MINVTKAPSDGSDMVNFSMASEDTKGRLYYVHNNSAYNIKVSASGGYWFNNVFGGTV